MKVCFIINIWRNIYLKRKILYYLNLHRIFSQNTYYFYLSDLELYPFKNYIHKLKILDINIALDQHYRDYIPNELNALSFTMDFNQEVSKEFLVESIESIKFSFSFNREIKENQLPSNLKHLELGHCYRVDILNSIKSLYKLETLVFPNGFNQDLKDTLVPLNSLKKLKFGFSFNTPIKVNQLPPSLTNLKFQMAFNSEIEPFLDQQGVLTLGNLKVLKFNQCSFNKPLHYLPESLTVLHLGKDFNQPLPESLPKSLTLLTFERGAASFNQELNSSLVNTSITYLKLSDRFNKNIKKSQLPTSLTILKFGYHFRGLIQDLPENLTQLAFDKNSHYSRPINFSFNHKLKSIHNMIPDMYQIPPSVSKISFSNKFYSNIIVSSIPSNVQSIELSETFDYPLDENFRLLSITSLKFGSYFNCYIGPNMLPSTLKKLEFGAQFENQGREFELGSIPANLEKLVFKYSYNLPLRPFVLPSGLLSLSFQTEFNQAFQENSLPNSLTYLKLSLNFNHPFEPNVLPKSLIYLSLGEQYDHPIKAGVLPHRLQVLELSEFYNHPIEPNTLPSSLIKIKLGGSFKQTIHQIMEQCKDLKLLFFGNSESILPQHKDLKDSFTQFLLSLSSIYIYNINSNLIANIITLINSNNNNTIANLSNIRILNYNNNKYYNFIKDF